GYRVVWRSERTLSKQSSLSIHLTGDRVYLCSFKSLAKLHGRKYCGKTLGKHGLATSRSPNHNHIMPASCSHFKCPLHTFLSLDICKVHFVIRGLIRKLTIEIKQYRLKLQSTVEESYHLTYILSSIYIQSFNNRSFPSIGTGKDDALKAVSLST